MRSGGQILVEALKIHGVDLVFGVPGESYLAVLDALYDNRDHIRLITCRQEGGAAFMAEAYGKLSGKPGICFVTRGPGATNGSIGVHTAFQDSSPMIYFVGQVARDQEEREAFQEIDYRRMFGPMSKWVAQIERAERIPELVSQAFHRAVNGRPGPVVLALPEDMLTDQADVADAGPYRAVQAAPAPADMLELHNLLSKAERPFLLLGGSGWNEEAAADIRRFAENFDLPVGCSFRCQDLYDNRAPNYAGDVGIGINPPLAKRIKDADLLIVVGPRLGEMTTSGYTLIDIPCPRQTLIHVHAGAEELGRVYQPRLGINSGMAHFARAAKTLVRERPISWRDWTRAAHQDYLVNITPVVNSGPVQMADLVTWLRNTLPDDAIVTNGAGNFASWVHRFYTYKKYRTQLGPTNGAMGYGVPAAIAAKLHQPHRTVVAFTGDGDFLMTGQELATAKQYGAAVIVILVNNGMYGTIRMHQEREYPARVHGTALENPDFVALANAYGVYAERIESTESFAAAFERAQASQMPALLEIRIDPEAITPRASLSAIRKAALAAFSS